MKQYTVHTMPEAEQAIYEQALFIAEDKPIAAEAWLISLWDAISELTTFPTRHPISEAETKSSKSEIRKLIFGQYIVYFRIIEEKQLVEVLSFRHGARSDEAPPEENE